MTEAALLEAAYRFATAYVATFEPAGTWVEAELELEGALHDLVLAAGETCPMCEPGTCPGAGRPIEDTAPL